MTFRAHYEREGTVGWDLSSWDAANTLLGYQKADGPSFSIFTIEGGSYVQCAGGKKRLTVECRMIQSDGSFQHYRFGKGNVGEGIEVIECNCGPIRVRESQVLVMRDAMLIIRHFVESGGGFHEQYVATDVSDLFA